MGAPVRNPNVVGGVWGVLWWISLGLALREIGFAAIPAGILFGVATGIGMRFAYSHGNRTEKSLAPAEINQELWPEVPSNDESEPQHDHYHNCADHQHLPREAAISAARLQKSARRDAWDRCRARSRAWTPPAAPASDLQIYSLGPTMPATTAAKNSQKTPTMTATAVSHRRRRALSQPEERPISRFATINPPISRVAAARIMRLATRRHRTGGRLHGADGRPHGSPTAGSPAERPTTGRRHRVPQCR